MIEIFNGSKEIWRDKRRFSQHYCYSEPQKVMVSEFPGVPKTSPASMDYP